MWYDFDAAGPRTNATRNNRATATRWSTETAKVRLSDADRLPFSFLYKFIIATTPCHFYSCFTTPSCLVTNIFGSPNPPLDPASVDPSPPPPFHVYSTPWLCLVAKHPILLEVYFSLSLSDERKITEKWFRLKKRKEKKKKKKRICEEKVIEVRERLQASKLKWKRKKEWETIVFEENSYRSGPQSTYHYSNKILSILSFHVRFP